MSQLLDSSPVRAIAVSAEAYVLVAIKETKEGMAIDQLKKEIAEQGFQIGGLSLHVWDDEKQVWVKLTKEMLKG